jgi:hypothetical protein
LVIMMVAGATVFVFSFMPFYSVDAGFETLDANAWEKGLFPLASFVALFGGMLAVMAAVRSFGNVRLPDRVLTFDVKQQGFVLAFSSLVIMLGFLMADTPDKGIGFWLMMVATVGLVIGSIMDLVEAPATPYGAYGPPGGYPSGGPGGPPSPYGGYQPGPPPGTYPPGFGPDAR